MVVPVWALLVVSYLLGMLSGVVILMILVAIKTLREEGEGKRG